VFYEADLSYAVDFALPFGTEVRAPSDGVVFEYFLNSDYFYDGLDQEIGNNLPVFSTNFMILLHEDNVVTWYSHLGKEVMIKRGQKVKKGDVIALTGKSGWVAQMPHLHFQQCGRSLMRISTPVVFMEWTNVLDHETLMREDKIWLG